MLKGLIGVIGGLIAGAFTVFLAESGGHLLWPPPPGVDLNDPEALKTLMSVIPLPAKLAVLVSWGAGTFVGSAVAIFLAGRASWPAWVTATILFGMALWTMTIIPHPDWMLFAASGITLLSAISAASVWARS
jgi:hypothetical protein